MYLDETYSTSSFDWKAFLWKYFSRRARSTGPAERGIEEEVYFIIDEAQCTWGASSSFWTKTFIPYLWETAGPRFCFFGLHPPNDASSSAVRTVASIDVWEQKFLKSTSPISLYYSESEFEDAADRYCLHAQPAIELNRSARRRAEDQPQSHSSRHKLNLDAVKKILENDETVFGRGEAGYEMGGPPLSPLNDQDYTSNGSTRSE
uniref:Uncharacterized protein n=1 Tax=Talaromyces marneffei PM1 TaxID=1077442 RepID=A0A093VBW2_TALMA